MDIWHKSSDIPTKKMDNAIFESAGTSKHELSPALIII